MDSDDSEYSNVDSEDYEDSDEEDLGPEFINFMNIIFGKLIFIGFLRSNWFFYWLLVCYFFSHSLRLLKTLF